MIRALVVVDAPKPRDEDVLLVEEAQLVIEIILVQVLDEEEVGNRYKQVFCTGLKFDHGFFDYL